MFIHKSLLTRKEKISPHGNILSLISVINFIDMIPRSAEQSGINGVKRPFDPNIITLVQPLAKRQYMMHRNGKERR